jgi:hypothetical protein
MFRRALVASIALLVLAALPAAAEATTVNDRDDPLPRLDIRRASVAQVDEHHLRLQLVFWDRTPQWELRRRAARIEMSDAGPAEAQAQFGFRFWPNNAGKLRISYGEPGSTCCGHARARHPDPFTYKAVIRFSLDGALIKSMRASRTTRLPPCSRPRCGLVGGAIVDRTRWVAV